VLTGWTGSFHGAVEPRHIVFSGDSAGGNLCLALLQTILELRRQNLKIRWNGKERDIPIPAGLALCSPWTDITHSSPSCETNAVYDYLPPPSRQTERMKYLECSIWPADPPRKNLYAEDAMLCHPLVSPLATKSWEGSCPLYIGIGTELLTDEGKYVAMRAARQGVAIRLEEYEAMPHCFALVLTSLPASSRFFTGWSDFIREVTTAPETKSTKGVFIKSKSLQEVPLQVTNLSSSTYEEVVERMRQRVQELAEANPDPMSKL
jgi:acetyl esterase/lipase